MKNNNNTKKNQVVAWSLGSEADFRALAARVARAWRDAAPPMLVVGLEGPLGAGKTTWVRGMLRGLGYRDRVPSPTYTLLEHYELGELTVAHLDLYRLSESAEEAGRDFEALGVRDWLARPGTWLLVEWPERSGALSARCDILIAIELVAETARKVEFRPRSPLGRAAIRGLESTSRSDSSLKG